MYNVVVRRVRVTVVVVEKSDKCYEFWVCVCSLSYPACIAHAPYYIVICALSAQFSTLSLKWHNWKKLLKKKCVLTFPTAFVWTFPILSRIQRDNNIHLFRPPYTVAPPFFFGQILIKLKFSRQIFENSSNIKFHKISPSWRRVVSCRRTDRQTWRN